MAFYSNLSDWSNKNWSISKEISRLSNKYYSLGYSRKMADMIACEAVRSKFNKVAKPSINRE